MTFKLLTHTPVTASSQWHWQLHGRANDGTDCDTNFIANFTYGRANDGTDQRTYLPCFAGVQ